MMAVRHQGDADTDLLACLVHPPTHMYGWTSAMPTLEARPRVMLVFIWVIPAVMVLLISASPAVVAATDRETDAVRLEARVEDDAFIPV